MQQLIPQFLPEPDFDSTCSLTECEQSLCFPLQLCCSSSASSKPSSSGAADTHDQTRQALDFASERREPLQIVVEKDVLVVLPCNLRFELEQPFSVSLGRRLHSEQELCSKMRGLALDEDAIASSERQPLLVLELRQRSASGDWQRLTLAAPYEGIDDMALLQRPAARIDAGDLRFLLSRLRAVMQLSGDERWDFEQDPQASASLKLAGIHRSVPSRVELRAVTGDDASKPLALHIYPDWVRTFRVRLPALLALVSPLLLALLWLSSLATVMAFFVLGLAFIALRYSAYPALELMPRCLRLGQQKWLCSSIRGVYVQSLSETPLSQRRRFGISVAARGYLVLAQFESENGVGIALLSRRRDQESAQWLAEAIALHCGLRQPQDDSSAQ
ncbi:MAG: hypothetical protein RBU37_10750 [Myxococcota bacterium]|nr:hypothetical protein [Myxococcota bacterium]